MASSDRALVGVPLPRAGPRGKRPGVRIAVGTLEGRHWISVFRLLLLQSTLRDRLIRVLDELALMVRRVRADAVADVPVERSGVSTARSRVSACPRSRLMGWARAHLSAEWATSAIG
jgi:hypothetical protein